MRLMTMVAVRCWRVCLVMRAVKCNVRMMVTTPGSLASTMTWLEPLPPAGGLALEPAGCPFKIWAFSVPGSIKSMSPVASILALSPQEASKTMDN